MDPLSGVASVIAIVQLAQAIGSALKAYYSNVREFRADIDRLFFSISSLESILAHVKLLSETSRSIILQNFVLDPVGPLAQLEIELEKIQVSLKSSLTKPQYKRNIIAPLKWPFQSKEVAKIVAVIEGHKTSLILNLEIGTL